MSKKIKYLCTFLLLVLATSCGFKKFNQNENSFYIQDIIVTGENRSAYTLKNEIRIASDKNSKKIYNMKINIIKKKNTKIKDETGKTIRYTVDMTANVYLENINGQKITNKSFFRNGDYDVVALHSDTVRNEKHTTKKIIENLSEDIITFIGFHKITR